MNFMLVVTLVDIFKLIKLLIESSLTVIRDTSEESSDAQGVFLGTLNRKGTRKLAHLEF